MNNAVQQALGVKPPPEARKFTLSFGNDKDLRSALNDLARTGPVKMPMANECAIPLLEMKGGKGPAIDTFLAKPAGTSKFDAIDKPAPIGPCPFRK